MKALLPESLKRVLRIMYFEFLCIIYGVDISKVKFIGVTGSSGKTTTSSMIYHILQKNNFKVGLISTVGVFAGDKELESGFHVTTPDPKDLVRFIKLMVNEGNEYVVLETSSHALEQGRIGPISFDFAIFTNITSDHLDWHKTWENYARAKARLIDRLKSKKNLIINQDDERSYNYIQDYLKDFSGVSYSLSELSSISENLTSLSFLYKMVSFEVRVIGRYNLSNLLASIKLGELLGIQIEEISSALKSYKQVEGRMEVIQEKPFAVILDFAHNADSLKNSLETLRSFLSKEGKLVSIFGSAGLRDINKRDEMGKISGEIADITIITAEDPRTESLFEINSTILDGVLSVNKYDFIRFPTHEKYIEFKEEVKKTNRSFSKFIFVFDEETTASRFDAIDLGVFIAREGDVVVSNGKGHEKTMAFGTEEYPYSDREALTRAISSK